MTVKIRLYLGEQDGKTYDLPDDIDQIHTIDGFDADDPPLTIWVCSAIGERELAHYKKERQAEPDGLREHLTRTAYRLSDMVDADGELVEFHYERDVHADIKPVR